MRKFFAVIALFLLAPYFAEFLFGATPLSNIGAFVLVIPLYGGGALLIRELAQRTDRDWFSIVLLGAAYGIIEEGFAIQSLFNPTLFNAAAYGGRWLGVNWIWTLWTLTYHSVVSISIPILLVELLFPAIRRQRWTSTAGLIVVALLYLLGTAGIGAVYRLFLIKGYSAPPLALAAAGLAVLLLVVLALSRAPGNAARIRTSLIPATGPGIKAPAAGWVGVLAFLAFAAVFLLLQLPQPLRAFPLVFIPVILYGILVVAAVLALRRWTAPRVGWTDRHSLSLVIGVVLVVMLDGFFFVLPSVGNPLDRLVQGSAGLITFVLLAFFAGRLSSRSAVETAHQGAEPRI